jgi:hypothetical protein
MKRRKIMNKKILLLILYCLFLSLNAFATRYWPTTILTDWKLYLNNNVAYIKSSQFASHCNYNRGQINLDGTEYNKALFAYAMTAQARGKNLRYVVDNTQTTCIISALEEKN